VEPISIARYRELLGEDAEDMRDNNCSFRTESRSTETALFESP
jgi:hypothetical protein